LLSLSFPSQKLTASQIQLDELSETHTSTEADLVRHRKQVGELSALVAELDVEQKATTDAHAKALEEAEEVSGKLKREKEARERERESWRREREEEEQRWRRKLGDKESVRSCCLFVSLSAETEANQFFLFLSNHSSSKPSTKAPVSSATPTPTTGSRSS
jgi:chromosome segregation ATPase